MRPIIDGGGQERGLRSGTLATPNVVGFGAACEICQKEMDRDKEHVSRLARKLLDGIREHLPKVILNGSETERYFGNVNLSFSAVEGESLLMALNKDLCVSSGSACTSASLEPSYVLRAIGVGDDLAHTSLRFGIGRFTTDEEVDNAIAKVIEQVTNLRELSPLWEMMVEAEESGEPLPKVAWS
ncbi:Cysteine desulfurase, mitochondrial [Perkinsus olseni]|nr:Cysteine desulfurase, mitochondrial [Perkinsus olseni]